MKSKSLIDSFNYALQGIINALHTERNLRFHFLLALSSLILALFYDFSKVEFMILTTTIVFVISAELFNTAIESIIDHICGDKCFLLAKKAKDVSAGAVFMVSVNALVVGYFLFYTKIDIPGDVLINKLVNAPLYLTFISLMVIVLMTIVIKAILNHKKPFTGGMPSGHSAVSFAIATIIAFLTKNMLAISLAYFLGFMVAQSRIEAKIHDILEVIAGALLGTTITIIIFQIFG